jgi:hypothetical protein
MVTSVLLLAFAAQFTSPQFFLMFFLLTYVTIMNNLYCII